MGVALKEHVDISFIILSWNSAGFLDGCLTSIQSDLAGSDLSHEIIVIDNGSGDDSRSILAGYIERGLPLTLIALGSNTGTTFSRNIGLRMARGRYLCILDSDIKFCQGKTMETLVKTLDTEPRAGIVAPMLVYSSGNHQKSFDQFPTLRNKLKRLFFLRKMEQVEGLQQFHARNIIEVDYVISAFWLFRRELMESIGLLDERIFYAPEDVDYCLRSWLNGSPVLFCSGVKVIHLAQEISRKRPFSKSAVRHLLGLAYYFRKYGYCFSLDRLYARIQASVAQREKEFVPNLDQVLAQNQGAAAGVAKSYSTASPAVKDAAR